MLYTIQVQRAMDRHEKQQNGGSMRHIWAALGKMPWHDELVEEFGMIVGHPFDWRRLLA
jgi:hypothetical protein